MATHTSKTVLEKVRSKVRRKGRGWVFTPAEFLELGPRANVGMALKRLCDDGTIRRLTRGVYDYPVEHPRLGTLLPKPDRIAASLAENDGARLQPSGAYAANLLGLSEQVPAKVVFLTDAPERRRKVGRQEIVLKATTPKNMATAGRMSGLVIQALRHLGRRHVDDTVVSKLRERLTPGDRAQLLQDVRYAPAWIADIFRRLNEDG